VLLFHRTSAAIEVLIFIIARKMVTPGLSGLELLAGVAALAGLVISRFYYLPGKPKEQTNTHEVSKTSRRRRKLRPKEDRKCKTHDISMDLILRVLASLGVQAKLQFRSRLRFAASRLRDLPISRILTTIGITGKYFVASAMELVSMLVRKPRLTDERDTAPWETSTINLNWN
jgi:hypothetical protein